MSAPTVAEAHRAKMSTSPADTIAYLVVLTFAVFVLLLAILLVGQLWAGSEAARQKLGWGFLFSNEWNPVTEQFGASPFIYGTLITSAVALFISIPLGVGAAIF